MTVRNRHLLAAVVCLALTTTFVSLFVLITERRTAGSLERLAQTVVGIEKKRLEPLERALAELTARMREIQLRDTALVGDISRIGGLISKIQADLGELAAKKVGASSLQRLGEELDLLGGELEAFVRQGVRWNVQIMALSKQLRNLQDRVAQGGR